MRIEVMRIEEQLSEGSLMRRQRAAKRQSAHFLKGPIPLTWLERASNLSGKTLTVGLVIWYRSGLSSTKTGIRIPSELRKRFGIERKAYYTALAAMEEAGLIGVQRRIGKTAIIEILTVDTDVAASE